MTLSATRLAHRDTISTSTGRSLALVYLGFGLRTLYLLILLPFYSRVLGSAAYGRVLAAMSLSQVVWMLAEYGFAAYGLREVASAASRRELGNVYARHVRARLLFAVPAVIVGGIGTFVSVPLREAPAFGLLATLNGAISAFNMGWYFQGLGRFSTSVALEVLGFAINLPLILATVHGPADSLRVLMSLVISGAVCTATAHVWSFRTCERMASTWRDAWTLARDAGALFAQRSLTIILASSSTYIMSAYNTAALVGVYGSAERIASVGLTLLQPANQVVTSTVSSRLGRGHQGSALRGYVRTAVITLTLFGVILCIGTLLFADLMVDTLLGPEFLPAAAILRHLGWIFPFAAFTQAVSGYVLIPLHRDGTVLRIMLLGALLALAGQMLLAPSYGGPGVALARLGGAVFTSIAFTWQVWTQRTRVLSILGN